MASTPLTVVATRVDPQTAACFREAMARVGSTPSQAIRLMIGAALAGPRIAPPANSSSAGRLTLELDPAAFLN